MKLIRPRSIVIAAMIAVAAFLVLVIALHILRPDVNPLRDDLSVYSVGPYAFLMQAAFVALGVAVLATGWTIGRRGWPALLMVSGLAAIAAAAFPTAATTPVTPTDYTEVALSLTFFVGFAVGSGVVSLRMVPGWHRRVAILSSLAFDACFVWMLFGPDAIHGLLMRCGVTLILTWTITQGARAL